MAPLAIDARSEEPEPSDKPRENAKDGGNAADSDSSKLFDGVRADLYRNDPYVWFSPYLWSFCHLNQNPAIELGMAILWLSKADGTFVCDLVFVVGKAVPFNDAVRLYMPLDDGVAEWHFRPGMQYHAAQLAKPGATTYVANMDRSYIPHPAVPLEDEIDAVRIRERPQAKPLAVAWARPSVPLRIEAIEELESTVRERANNQITGALGSGSLSPGQPAPLR
jgi:hypothetical protein